MAGEGGRRIKPRGTKTLNPIWRYGFIVFISNHINLIIAYYLTLINS